MENITIGDIRAIVEPYVTEDVWRLDDGSHRGEFEEITYNESKSRFFIRIAISDKSVFVTTMSAKKFLKIVFPEFESYEDDTSISDFSGYYVEFSTKINETDNGSRFCNIISFKLLDAE